MTLARNMDDAEKYLDLLMEKALSAIENNDKAAIESAKGELEILISQAKKHEEASEKEKVFCSKCKYIESYGNKHEDYYCTHPKNTILTSDWRDSYEDYVSKPHEINKDGDCKCFEPSMSFSAKIWVNGFFTK